MRTHRFDAVIAGGGLSGLSLAAHLATQGWGDRSVLVVDDPRTRPSAVSWGFWSAKPALLDKAISRSYGQVRIHGGGTSQILPIGRYRYHVVRRPDLQSVVRDLLASRPGYEIRHGRVDQISADDDEAVVTVDGETVGSGWVFDSVTPAAQKRADARLAFTGWELCYSHPVFDPATPVLFDFRVQQANGSRFVYVLPSDPFRALVEVTEFVPRMAHPPGAAERSAALSRYLADAVPGRDYQVLRKESSVLALRTHTVRRRAGRIIAIGAAAGLIKASTGYAFGRIQRNSAAIAASLVQHGHPYATPAPARRYRLLDAILLDVLARDPAQLELAFVRLFSANPADRVLRFLDEESRPWDDLRLIASMPPMPYLRALGRRLLRHS
jgi:lycopene beta-cyclase